MAKAAPEIEFPPGWQKYDNNDILDSSTRSLGVSSVFSVNSVPTKSPLARESRVKKMVCKGRISFLLILGVIGLGFAFLSFFLLGQGERELADLHYSSIANKAIKLATEAVERKRSGLLSLSSVISGANPDDNVWPLVKVTNFETISNHLMSTSNSYAMGFAPFITADQVSSFEAHAYEFYETSRSPEPFPEGTAVSQFGKGIHSWNETTQSNYHDTTGETSWDSHNKILAPILHHSKGIDPSLMSNLYSDKSTGEMIDAMIHCVSSKSNLFDVPADLSLDTCTMLSGISPKTNSWSPSDGEKPWSSLIQPVYAQKNPAKLTGAVVTSFVWEDVLSGPFHNSISGVHVVLESDNGGVYTYLIQEGQAVLLGEGDMHDATFDDYKYEVELMGDRHIPIHDFTEVCISYKLCLYPTNEFFASFETQNPLYSAVAVAMILIVTSVLFTIYDVLIKRGYYIKKDLLEAKRKFIRFVAHEVLTPLNSVHMGLTFLRGELEGGSGNRNPNVASLPRRRATDNSHLVSMAHEIAMNCNGAVDILNDFITFDKIQTDKLNLDFSVIRLFDLVETTSKDFKMVAENSSIKLTVNTPMSPEKTDEAPKECFTVGDTSRITHLLRNLINNALESTPDGGRVEIKAVWLPVPMKGSKNAKNFVLKDGKKMKVNRNGFMKFSVSDTGKGLTQVQIRKLLHRGTSFNVNDLQAGNTSGLGVWVAKGIVGVHGGTLTAQSDGVGEGSMFTISLPTYDIMDPSPDPKAKKSLDAKELLGILKVLVVDDAKMNLKLLMRLVSKKGHKVDGAEDGAIAVEKASKAMADDAEYDVILMDYQMPNMDGPTATRILRNMGCSAFICGVTGNCMAEDIQYFKKCGANEVLHKPAKIKALEDLWVEYGLRGEILEGAHDGMVEGKKKVEVKRLYSDCSDMTELSLSSLSLGGVKPPPKAHMSGSGEDTETLTPEYSGSRKTVSEESSSDVWASRRSTKSNISATLVNK